MEARRVRRRRSAASSSSFLAANLTKIVSGGWLPLLIAAIVVTVMTTWQRGRRSAHRPARRAGRAARRVRRRVQDRSASPGCPALAVFPHPNKETAPLALRAQRRRSTTCCTSTSSSCRSSTRTSRTSAHVDRVVVDDLGYADDGIVHSACASASRTSQDIPKGLALAIGQSPELDAGRRRGALLPVAPRPCTSPALPHRKRWRTRLFVWLAHNAASRTEVFHLPPDRTVIMGANLNL